MQILLGTLNFDYPYTSGSGTYESYLDIVRTYANHQKVQGEPVHIDTAYYYGNTKTEGTLGRILKELDVNALICTKANPWHLNDFTSGQYGGLSPASLEHQITTSLRNLSVSSVDTFLLHAFDYDTDLSLTLDACDSLFRREKFDHFGVSNFNPDQVRQVHEICDQDLTLTLDTYQGMYNLACRKVEPVIDLMHDIGGRFIAYNPLAGGLLTGKYRQPQEKSRFTDNQIYKNIFWKQPILDFIHNLEDPLKESLFWLKSRKIEGIVLGASNSSQLIQNLTLLMPRDLGVSKDYPDLSAYSPECWY